MKAETKSKRRVTLSFCRLAVLDELEVESISNATKQQVTQLYISYIFCLAHLEVPAAGSSLGATMLPDLSPTELQKLFDSVPAVNGKKAPAFVEKVLSMAVEF